MHYKDGQKAEIGDIVKGVPYNTGGKTVVGELIQVTPGSESCNCIVAFVMIENIARKENETDDNALIYRANNAHVLQARPADGLAGQNAHYVAHALNVQTDYGQCSDFELVHRPE